MFGWFSEKKITLASCSDPQTLTSLAVAPLASLSPSVLPSLLFFSVLYPAIRKPYGLSLSESSQTRRYSPSINRSSVSFLSSHSSSIFFSSWICVPEFLQSPTQRRWLTERLICPTISSLPRLPIDTTLSKVIFSVGLCFSPLLTNPILSVSIFIVVFACLKMLLALRGSVESQSVITIWVHRMQYAFIPARLNICMTLPYLFCRLTLLFIEDWSVSRSMLGGLFSLQQDNSCLSMFNILNFKLFFSFLWILWFMTCPGLSWRMSPLSIKVWSLTCSSPILKLSSYITHCSSCVRGVISCLGKGGLIVWFICLNWFNLLILLHISLCNCWWRWNSWHFNLLGLVYLDCGSYFM